jgi:acetolactate synthase I/III small subunit
MRQTLSVLVNDEPGVLSRVAGLFSRRGFNIDSLTVGPTEEAGLSRMTITTNCDAATLEQISKQLYKLIDVLNVQSLSNFPMVERELLLIKVHDNASTHAEISSIVDAFRASIVDVGRSTVVIQATGNYKKNNALIELLRPYGVTEIARTGATAMIRSQVKQVRAV